METKETAIPETAFEYTPLPDAATYIRLIEIQPAGEDKKNQISIRIHIMPIQDAPPYLAISYT